MWLKDLVLLLTNWAKAALSRKGRKQPKPSTITNLRGFQEMSKTVRLNWVDPTTRVDGSALAPTDIAAVTVFMSADLGANFVELGSVAAGVQTFRQTDLPDGTYQFKVVVTDKQTPVKSSAAQLVEVIVVTILAEPSGVSGLVATVE